MAQRTSALIALAFRALRATWRIRWRGREILESALAEGPVILACWHAEQLALFGAHLDRGFVPMVSLSRDGEILAGALPRLGYGVVRGSSSRGGREALDESLRLLAEGMTPALAVDGPRGPLGVPKAGAAVLSARSGRPIILMSARVWPALRLRSWDRFQIPLPLARVEVAYARVAPPSRDEQDIARTTQAIAAGLHALSDPGPTPPAPGTDRR